MKLAPIELLLSVQNRKFRVSPRSVRDALHFRSEIQLVTVKGRVIQSTEQMIDEDPIEKVKLTPRALARLRK
jgi:hypothetical protein